MTGTRVSRWASVRWDASGPFRVNCGAHARFNITVERTHVMAMGRRRVDSLTCIRRRAVDTDPDGAVGDAGTAGAIGTILIRTTASLTRRTACSGWVHDVWVKARPAGEPGLGICRPRARLAA